MINKTIKIFNTINIRFVRFVSVGFISTIIDISLLYVLVEYALFNLYVAATISFIVSSINGYWLNNTYTFNKSSDFKIYVYLKFLTVVTFGLLFTLLILKILTSLNIDYLIAKIIATVVVSFWNFTLNKFWTFR